MIIIERRGFNYVFFVYSSSEEWDNLIVSNIKNCKNTYVFDPYSYRGRYPDSVKFIKSIPTTRRFMGVRLSDTFIFINSVNTEISRKFIDNMVPFRRTYYLIRIELRDLVKLVKKRELELCCRRSMKTIQKYV